VNKIPEKIVLIGSGNVATSLGLHFKQHGISIVHVYSRNLENAKELAAQLKCTFNDQLDSLPAADLYLLCVNDSVIEDVSSRLIIPPAAIVAHTSGTISIDSLNDHENRAILYPLQTLKTKNVEMDSVPFLLEASTPDLLNTIIAFALKFTKSAIPMDSDDRKQIHLAAVFANNFSNHMLTIAFKILKDNNIDSSLLLPLIKQTFNSLAFEEPKVLQTGPARRNDTVTIENHVNMLSNDNFIEIYKAVTSSIKQTYKDEH
jgi:predicted short-subunit dehydrogenase-like oxidoreductase (DUF2520 family)